MSDYQQVLLISLFISYSTQGISGTLTERPKNVVALAGDAVILQCATNKSHADPIGWSFGIHPIAREDFVCTDGRCPLNRTSVRTTEAGPYSCTDGAPTGELAQAALIVLDPKPACVEVQTSLVDEGDTFEMNCSMQYTLYTGSVEPKAAQRFTIAWWTDQPISFKESLPQPSGKLETSFSLTANCSVIPSHTCVANFEFTTPKVITPYIEVTNNVSWSCKSGSIIVRCCPKNVTITPSSGPYLPGSNLTCVSDGHPQPTYEWTGTHSAAGSTLTLPSAGQQFNVTCIVTVTVRNVANSTCQASSTISGTITHDARPPFRNNTTSTTDDPYYVPFIAVSVCLGVTLLALVVVCIILCYQRCHNKASESRQGVVYDSPFTQVGEGDYTTPDESAVDDHAYTGMQRT